MTDRDTQDQTSTPAAKDPEDWTTGDEPITGPQRSYLETLAQQAGQELPEDLGALTKAEASKRIDELQAAAGRGQ
ncbi:DUF3072 domain-containing protein [Pseudonocardia halophobica]|uniref:DUF3072 domain-containing protein n=1 Tax=Pseudonocardia halophobica TaxID=29401 RepID=A0A9W6NW00_9PSEU|nr:DUF3072 domain-containing protein [Pseudonocardia halophobica]GLL11096.1 DUF3072 domain-containing protein [Pseudonocardia halophobica]